MGERMDRLHGHVATQYERRGLDRTRADRIRDLVPEPPAEAAAGEAEPEAAPETPAAEVQGDG